MTTWFAEETLHRPEANWCTEFLTAEDVDTQTAVYSNESTAESTGMLPQ